MEQSLLVEIAKYGIGGILAVFFYVREQKAIDRYDKLRDAMDQMQKQHHEKTLELQKQGFDHALRVEGALQNSNQVLAANAATMQGITKALLKPGVEG